MKLLTAREVAVLLKLKPQRVYELARGGKIPSVRVGRQVRFDESALRHWIETGGSHLPGGWRQQ